MSKKKENVKRQAKQLSKLNNFGKKSHLLTREDKIKGGRVSSWKSIKRCLPTCRFWDSCNYRELSFNEINKGKCAVKSFPPLAVKSFLRLKTGKESEYNKHGLELLDDFLTDSCQSKQDKLTAFMKMGAFLFGTKMRTKISNDGGNDFVVRFKKEGEK